MPTWRTQLPPQEAHRGFDLRRTPQSASLQAVITSETLLVCDTHYWHGRTTPCERQLNEQGKTIDDSMCPACVDKAGYRTHCYVSAYDARASEHFIFECTTHAAKPLQDYFDATGTLRGCVLHASRPKGTPNGKVCIQTNTANLAKINLPAAPDLPRALAVIWRIPLAPATIDSSRPDTETHRIDRVAAARIRRQPDNMPDPPTIAQVLGGNGQAKRQKASA